MSLPPAVLFRASLPHDFIHRAFRVLKKSPHEQASGIQDLFRVPLYLQDMFSGSPVSFTLNSFEPPSQPSRAPRLEVRWPQWVTSSSIFLCAVAGFLCAYAPDKHSLYFARFLVAPGALEGDYSHFFACHPRTLK